MQRDLYRAQRRAYRRQRRGYYGGGFGGLIVLAIILVSFSHLFWMFFPLVFFGIPFFVFVLRPLLSGTLNQPPYNQHQQQPYNQQGPVYQPYQQQPQEDPSAYQPYNRGYEPQQSVSKPVPDQESHQQYTDGEQQQTQQYEDPLTMYPRE
ncbi:MAG TPA: hypothetical protein VGF67_16995 [Ktedonobacteraceae bacterium]|jgi:hypothetical protein